MEQDQKSKTTSEHLKDGITNFMDSFSHNTKEILHKIVDKTSETGQRINEEVNNLKTKAGDELNKIMRKLSSQDISDLEPGDLVLSTIDITNSTGKLIPRNQVLEFYVELKANSAAMASLYFPTAKQAMKFGEDKQIEIIQGMLPKTESDADVRLAYTQIKQYVLN